MTAPSPPTQPSAMLWPSVAIHLAASAFLLITACGDETCAIVEGDDGTISITCPGQSVEFPPCESDLPDLDGDGAVSEADCELAGVGAAQRALCSDIEAWWTLPACRAVETATMRVATVVRSAKSISGPPFRNVFATSDNLSVWSDLNDDGRYAQSEERVISASLNINHVELGPDVVVGWGDRLAVVWRDANYDGLPDIEEVAELELFPQGRQLMRFGTIYHAGSYALVYQAVPTPADPAPPVRVWRDVDGDRQITSSEIVEIPSASLQDTAGSSVHVQMADGRRVWTPLPDTWTTGQATMRPATEQEERCVELVTLRSGNVLCREFPWLGSGLLVSTPNSWQRIPLSADMIDIFDDQVVAVRQSSDTWSTIWTDVDHNLFPDPGELRAVVGRAVFLWARARVHSFRSFPSGGYLLHTWHAVASTRFLGETCDAASQACAGGLVCRVSGNNPESRCVPPAP